MENKSMNPQKTGRFTIPRAYMETIAKDRFRALFRGFVVTGLFVFLLFLLLSLFSGRRITLSAVIVSGVIGLLSFFSGVLGQWILLRRFVNHGAETIELLPGKILVDNAVYTAEDLTVIRVSPVRVAAPKNPKVFREVEFVGTKKKTVYRIDFAKGKPYGSLPFWGEYAELFAALKAWGEENGVAVNEK